MLRWRFDVISIGTLSRAISCGTAASRPHPSRHHHTAPHRGSHPRQRSAPQHPHSIRDIRRHYRSHVISSDTGISSRADRHRFPHNFRPAQSRRAGRCLDACAAICFRRQGDITKVEQRRSEKNVRNTSGENCPTGTEDNSASPPPRDRVPTPCCRPISSHRRVDLSPLFGYTPGNTGICSQCTHPRPHRRRRRPHPGPFPRRPRLHAPYDLAAPGSPSRGVRKR